MPRCGFVLNTRREIVFEFRVTYVAELHSYTRNRHSSKTVPKQNCFSKAAYWICTTIFYQKTSFKYTTKKHLFAELYYSYHWRQCKWSSRMSAQKKTCTCCSIRRSYKKKCNGNTIAMQRVQPVARNWSNLLV